MCSSDLNRLTKSHDVISDFLSTYSENRDLKKSLSTVENQSAVISNLQEENDSLRASLNLSDKLSRNNVITAEVSMRPSVTWLKELTINVGKSKNVSKSMLATSNGGVIGFITKIYDHSTTISLLSNSSNDSYIASSVNGEDGSQIFGIISGYDNKKKLLEMSQLNSSSDVKVGSEVVTSGLDEVSVKNVPIGTVESVQPRLPRNSSNKYYTCVYRKSRQRPTRYSTRKVHPSYPNTPATTRSPPEHHVS